MAERSTRQTFLDFSSEITAYSGLALEGTGLVDTYKDLLETVLGQVLTSQFYALADAVVSLSDPAAREERIRSTFVSSAVFWPIASNLISLWYLGSWLILPPTWYAATDLPQPGPTDPGRTHVPSARAYIEQLSYRSAGAHTPGAKPTGFASWSIPPVF